MAVSSASTASPPPALDLSHGRGPCFIGRSVDCDLMLDDLRVARRHARVRMTQDGIELTDLSGAGVFVNGERVHSATLMAGDVIRIGPYPLVAGGAAIPSQEQGSGLHRV